MRTPGIVTIMLWALLSMGQDVHVSSGKGSVALSLSALRPYEVISGEKKTPVLSLECSQKGSKSVHVLKFTAGGSLAENDLEAAPKNGSFSLNMVVGGNKQITTWIPYGDTITFAYYGKTELERVQFIQLLLSSPTASIEFTPFLTGTPTTSVFDIGKLGDEMNRHSECSLH